MKLLSKIGSSISGAAKIFGGVALYMQHNPGVGVMMILSGIGTITGQITKQPENKGS